MSSTFWAHRHVIHLDTIFTVYTKELTLTKSNRSSDYTPFLDLDITLENGTLKTKIYDKRDDFDFPIVNFRSLMEMYLLHLHMVYIYHNLFALHVSVVMSRTSMNATYVSQKNCYIRVIVITDF